MRTSARSSGSTPAWAARTAPSSNSVMRRMRFTLASIAAATAATAAGGAARAFARLVDVARVGARDRIPIERHDRIGEVVALVRLDPRLNAAAGDGKTASGEQ